MANLFEKPIAATPIQQFTQLPLQFIQASLDRRQRQYETAKAQAAQYEDVLAQTKALTGDTPRHREIIESYDKRLDQIIEDAGGDYSAITGSLDTLTRDLKRDLNYGELGAINTNFNMAMKEAEDLKKRYLDGKVNEAGYKMALQQMGGFQTQMGEHGDWGRFSGYQPSNVVNAYKELQDSVDEINAKYDEQGAKFVDNQSIVQNVNTLLKNKPNVLKSLQENWRMSGSEASFQEYYEDIISGVVSDKAYHQVLKSTEGGSDKRKLAGMAIDNVGLPSRTASDFKGGTMPGIRGFLKDVTGLDTTKEFDDYINSSRGKEEIAYMEAKSGSKMPTDHAERVEWITNQLEQGQTGTVVTEDTPRSLAMQVVDDKGVISTQGAIYDRAGNLMKADDMLDIQGKTEDGRVAKMIGRVGQGSTHPAGTYVILGKDGEMYFQEPSDAGTLQSSKYNSSLINMAKYSATGRSSANLRVPLRDPSSQEVLIPAGNYETRALPGKNSVVLYQNGTAMYMLDANNQAYALDKEEE